MSKNIRWHGGVVVVTTSENADVTPSITRDATASVQMAGARKAAQHLKVLTQESRKRGQTVVIRGHFGLTTRARSVQPFNFSHAIKQPDGQLLSIVSAKANLRPDAATTCDNPTPTSPRDFNAPATPLTDRYIHTFSFDRPQRPATHDRRSIAAKQSETYFATHLDQRHFAAPLTEGAKMKRTIPVQTVRDSRSPKPSRDPRISTAPTKAPIAKSTTTQSPLPRRLLAEPPNTKLTAAENDNWTPSTNECPATLESQITSPSAASPPADQTASPTDMSAKAKGRARESQAQVTAEADSRLCTPQCDYLSRIRTSAASSNDRPFLAKRSAPSSQRRVEQPITVKTDSLDADTHCNEQANRPTVEQTPSTAAGHSSPKSKPPPTPPNQPSSVLDLSKGEESGSKGEELPSKGEQSASKGEEFASSFKRDIRQVKNSEPPTNNAVEAYAGRRSLPREKPQVNDTPPRPSRRMNADSVASADCPLRRVPKGAAAARHTSIDKSSALVQGGLQVVHTPILEERHSTENPRLVNTDKTSPTKSKDSHDLARQTADSGRVARMREDKREESTVGEESRRKRPLAGGEGLLRFVEGELFKSEEFSAKAESTLVPLVYRVPQEAARSNRIASKSRPQQAVSVECQSLSQVENASTTPWTSERSTVPGVCTGKQAPAGKSELILPGIAAHPERIERRSNKNEKILSSTAAIGEPRLTPTRDAIAMENVNLIKDIESVPGGATEKVGEKKSLSRNLRKPSREFITTATEEMVGTKESIVVPRQTGSSRAAGLIASNRELLAPREYVIGGSSRPQTSTAGSCVDRPRSSRFKQLAAQWTSGGVGTPKVSLSPGQQRRNSRSSAASSSPTGVSRGVISLGRRGGCGGGGLEEEFSSRQTAGHRVVSLLSRPSISSHSESCVENEKL